jgi:hypothetical protein
MHDAKTHLDDEYAPSDKEIGGTTHKIQIRRVLKRTGRSQLWTLVYQCISERLLIQRRMVSRQHIQVRRPSNKEEKETNLWRSPRKPSQCYWDPAVFNVLPEEQRARQVGLPKVVFPHPPPGVAPTKQWVMDNIINNRSWFQPQNLEKLKEAEQYVLNAYDVPSEEAATLLLEMAPYSPSDSSEDA